MTGAAGVVAGFRGPGGREQADGQQRQGDVLEGGVVHGVPPMWFGVYTNMTSNDESIFTFSGAKNHFSRKWSSREEISIKITHGEIDRR